MASRKIKQVPELQKIVYVSTYCFEECWRKAVLMTKDGDVYYAKTGDKPRTEFYIAKGQQSLFNKIDSGFKKADLPNLLNDYDFKGTDQGTDYTTFITDTGIYKSIRDYGLATPPVFKKNYTEINLSLKKVHFAKLQIANHLKNYSGAFSGVLVRVEGSFS